MNPIQRYSAETLDVVEIDRGFWKELYISCVMAGRDSLMEIELKALKDLAAGCAGHIRVFGGAKSITENLSSALNNANISVYRFELPGGNYGEWLSLGAFLIQAKGDSKILNKTLWNGSSGWLVEAPGVKMGYLSRMASSLAKLGDAYLETYEQTLLGLKDLGFGPEHLTRTWCYFRDILAEYGNFNRVRKNIFIKYGILNGVIPASTGIQGILDSGEHLVMDALAFSGSKILKERVMNRAQREAPEYGSLFSRAMLVKGAGPDQLIVSGLAAVGKTGETEHVDNAPDQVDDTISNAERLLKDSGFSWKDTVSGIIYIKPSRYTEIINKLEDTPLKDLPFCITFVDVCRDDLLFEIEFMAFRP